MNDGMLSQDEIDALLNNTNDDIETVENDESGLMIEDYLSSLKQDALGEIGNISFGSSATTLSTLLNQKVEITTPTISVIKNSHIEKEFPHPHVGIQVEYTEGFSGKNLFVLKTKDAAIIADLMLGGDGTSIAEELNDIHLSAVQEAMNQMMGTAATSMSTVFNKRVDISPPTTYMLDIEADKNTDRIPEDDVLVKVSFQLKIGNLIDSNIMQLLPIAFAGHLVDELLNPSNDDEKNTSGNQQDRTTSNDGELSGNDHIQVKHATGVGNEPNHFGEITSNNANIQSATFSNFEDTHVPSKERRNLDMLLDIPLKVTVELGRTKRTVKDILDLSSGSVIELDKLAGEPVDIHVNDKLIAKGEVVVIEENFGVRVTDIVSQTDRIQKLK